MAYLDKKEWQKQLKLKEHTSIKKTGISDCLSNCEKAAKKNDKAAQVLALEKLRDKIDEVKKKYPRIKTLNDYLDKMKKEAKVEEDNIANTLEKAAEDDELEGADSTLADALEKLRKASEDSPHNFALAPGKPSTGLVVSRKNVKQSDIKKAMDMRGKSGTYFTGSCFYNAGKFTFDFPEQPPSGIARAIRMAARLHAELNIKVLVRGGGVEFDDEADADLDEAGEARAASGGVKKYPAATAFDPLIEKIKNLPQETRGPAATGLVGKINQLKSQASEDKDLSSQQRTTIIQNLDQALDKVKRATAEAPAKPEAPKSKYPTIDQWSELLERCLRVDPAKRRPAVDALRKKMVDTATAVQNDDSLSDEDRKKEIAKLAQVKKLVAEGAKEYLSAAKEAVDTGQIARLRALETEFDMARKQALLPDDIQKDVAKAIIDARKSLAGGDEKKIAEALNDLEAKVKAANSVANQANAALGQSEKQNRVYDSVKQGIEVFKKGAFAPGTADMLFRSTKDVKMDSGLKKIGDDFKKCEANPSAQNLQALSNDGQKYLVDIRKKIAKLNPEKDGDKLKELQAQELLAVQAVQRVRLLELANDMEAIGSPPWDDEKNERMAELQVSFFFEEGAIKHGVADFGAPELGGDDAKGVNEAWWIKRAEATSGRADPNDPDSAKKSKASERTYIFKAQDLEATKFPGLPENGGAVREALASKLNDALVNYGFDVGVCPTHLVDIDTAKLGGQEGSESPRTFGAVQQLAENKGPVIDELRKDSVAFGKSVSRKNCSDIVAFDLMFLNLDRHAGNLLVQENEDGGNTLVPIDHGICLPDPEGLAMSRFRMTGPQNTMMFEELGCNELLDEETRANIKKMDARKMTEELKKKQRETEKRHPETKGKLDPGEFDRMALRIEFMREAADVMTAREMTQAIAGHAKEIYSTDPKDLPKLVAKLKKKLSAVNAGAKDVDALVDKSVRLPLKLFSDLGWCVNFHREALENWVSENGDFAARVLKAKISNPAALKEVRKLLDDINDPEVDKQVQNLTLGDKLSTLRDEAAKRENERKQSERTALPEGKKEQTKLINDLGGKNQLQEITQAYPGTNISDPLNQAFALRCWNEFSALGGVAELKALEKYFPGVVPPSLDLALSALEQWDEIKKMGGMSYFLDIGGAGDSLNSIVKQFRELKALKDSGQVDEIMSIDQKNIDDEQKKFVEANYNLLLEEMKKILVISARTEFAEQVKAIDELIKKGSITEAQGKAEHLLPKLEKQATSEAAREKELSESLANLRAIEHKAHKENKAFDNSNFRKARHAAAKLVERHEFDKAVVSINKIDLELDEALNGEDSRAVKMSRQIKLFSDQLDALNGAPGAEKAKSKWSEAIKAHDELDLTRYTNLAKEMGEYLRQVDYYAKLDPFVQGYKGKKDIKEDLMKFHDNVKNELANYNPGAAKVQVKKIKEKYNKQIPEDKWPKMSA